jgi:hypothetical protein
LSIPSAGWWVIGLMPNGVGNPPPVSPPPVTPPVTDPPPTGGPQPPPPPTGPTVSGTPEPSGVLLGAIGLGVAVARRAARPRRVKAL